MSARVAAAATIGPAYVEASGCIWCPSCGVGYVSSPEAAESWMAKHNAGHPAALKGDDA